MKRNRFLMAAMLIIAMPNAMASVQASLDRDSVALGDSITLTITSDAAGAQPDLAPLRVNFDVRGSSTSSQTTIVNGRIQSSVQWAVELVPRKAGTIDIPALAVGRERTPPMHVGVSAQPTAQPSAQTTAGGAQIFIETSVEPTSPYLQQAIVYTERLYYAVTLINGAFDAPTPDNGDVRQIGNETTTSVMLQGHRYNVLERHYLLQPEHSGAMHIPGPGFVGHAMGDTNDVFDDGAAAHAVGKPIDVPVRARPPQAPDPWLPAQAIAITADPPTAPLHAGEPFSIVVKLDGEGVTAAQLPEIALPAIAGAQVYPEPSSTVEQQRDGRLLAERTRRFAIVPGRAGELRMPSLEVPWWDVANDRAALARLALPALQVLPAAASQNDAGNASSIDHANASNPTAAPAASSATAIATRRWQVATLCLAAMLMLSLWWGWRRGRDHAVARDDMRAHDDGAIARAPNRAPTLSRALALGDPPAIAQALLEAVPGSPARNLGE
ncbi:MAG TPA: BatD family protein, partial [Xanthomonadaceae bacterium]|nr:BatD family protein [Xanthomonadaceae bacterium]